MTPAEQVGRIGIKLDEITEPTSSDTYASGKPASYVFGACRSAGRLRPRGQTVGVGGQQQR